MKNYEKGMIPRVIWGSGSASRIAPELMKLGAQNCLIVSGKHMIHHQITIRILKEIEDAGIAYQVYTDVTPEPTDIICMEIAEKIKNMQADCVVAIGGGSPMDAAKAGALIAGINEPIEDLHEYGKTGTKMKEYWDRPCHLILVPTTSGTGAETTASGVISSTIHGLKFSFGNSHISPDLAVIDPEFTLGMPAKATIYGGLDTLAHAVEIIVGIASNEYTNTILLKCVEKVWKWLPVAVNEPDNLEAREQLSWAAHNALANGGVPNGHAAAHAIGGIYHITHGHACAMVLPTVIRHFSEYAADEIRELAAVMGVTVSDNPATNADRVADAVRRFYKDAGLKPLKETLTEQGLAESEKEFTEKMIPVILDDFKSKAWMPPIHTGDYKQKVGKVCSMIYEEK